MQSTWFGRGALSVLAAGAIVAGSVGVARAVEQRVEWNNVSNAAPRANGLQKIGGCQGCEDSGGESRQVIRGNGYAEFSIGEPYTFWMAGLSRPASGMRFSDIDYAFRFNGDGRADIMENGQYQPGVDVDYAPGDTFRVAVMNGRVQYAKNGRVLHESRRQPSGPLVLKAVLATQNASIRNARIETNGSSTTTSDDRYGYRNREGQYGRVDYRQFRVLDTNRDGVIERREWRGTRREFNDLDSDGNGVLSRAEMGNYSNYSRDNYGYRGTSGAMYNVSATEQWTDTGIWVEAGDMLNFYAEGSVQLSSSGGDVSTPAGAQSGRRANNAPLRTAPAGALLARIGNGAPIMIGNGRNLRAIGSGELFLGVNDDYMQDNRGGYRVSIDVNNR
jgi:EF hand domain-containing protein